MLTIENIHKIVGGKFRLNGLTYEVYSFNDYPGRYEYWFWYRPIDSTGRDIRIVLKRRSLWDFKGEQCYKMLSENKPFILVHPDDIQKPYGLLNLIEKCYG